MLGSHLLLGGRKLCSDHDMFIGKRRERDEACAAREQQCCHLDQCHHNKNQTGVWILGLEDRTEGFLKDIKKKPKKTKNRETLIHLFSKQVNLLFLTLVQ